MRSYIVTCKTSSDDLRELHIEARNHAAAAKAVAKQGFIVVSVDREDETNEYSGKRRGIKRVIATIVTCLVLAAICLAVIYIRNARH